LGDSEITDRRSLIAFARPALHFACRLVVAAHVIAVSTSHALRRNSRSYGAFSFVNDLRLPCGTGTMRHAVMAAAKSNNTDLGRSKPRIGLGELAGGTFLLSGFIFAIVWLSGSSSERTPPLPPPNIYTGSIVIPSADNECRRLAFDNISGLITDQGTGACSTTQGSGRTSVLSAISNSFRGK
jgi:hypothetical protein